MTVRVLMFASLAQATGVRETTLELPDRATVADALSALSARHPAVAAARDRLATAVNMAYVPADRALHDGDQVALIPPVSGG